MDVIQEQSAIESVPANRWVLTPVATMTHGLTYPSGSTSSAYMGKFYIKNCEGIILSKMIVSHPLMTIVVANETIPVISMAAHTTVFGSYKLKSNVTFVTSAQDISGSPVPVPVTNPNPVLKKKLHGLGQAPLEKFVAKQLFDLAILRKEMCPITAEEFSVGNTAVMPCGHLFMQFAIEESFKKEPNKCPWCRQHGSPTVV